MQIKKNILFFLNSSVGGAERITITIAKMLPIDKYEVKFIVVDKEQGNISKFIPSTYSVEYLLLPNIWYFGTTRIYNIISRERPHAVFCSTMYLNCRIAIAAHILHVRCILRNCNYMSTQRFDKKILCRLAYPLADTVISQQEEMADDIVKEIGISRDKIKTLHNPIDLATINTKLENAENPYPKDKQTNFVWVARVNRQKGQDIAIEAFAKMYQKVENAHLYLVGKYDSNSEYVKSLITCINEHDIKERVHFTGFDTNPYKWILYADCFVLPSRIEGLPNTLIEAQYLGTSAAAVRCIPIIERIVNDGINGYTAESENPGSLALAMEKAVRLGRVQMTYKSATDSDFIQLFE